MSADAACGTAPKRRFWSDCYRRVLGAVAEASYDAPGMMECMNASGRYGPWHAGILGRHATGPHPLPAALVDG